MTTFLYNIYGWVLSSAFLLFTLHDAEISEIKLPHFTAPSSMSWSMSCIRIEVDELMLDFASNAIHEGTDPWMWHQVQSVTEHRFIRD